MNFDFVEYFQKKVLKACFVVFYFSIQIPAPFLSQLRNSKLFIPPISLLSCRWDVLQGVIHLEYNPIIEASIYK